MNRKFFYALLFISIVSRSEVSDQFILEDGFQISVFATALNSPRQMAEGKNGTIFVGERGGQILALLDSDNNAQIDTKIILAKDLTFSTGVSIFNGDLYF